MTRRDDGAALVEFTLLAVVLLVPIVYLVIVAASVQRTAFAVSGAVRGAARAYVTAGSDALGRARATAAVQLALADAHVPFAPGDFSLTCFPAPCTFRPGSSVTVSLDVPVALPGLSALVCAHACRTGIPVRARHTELVACFVSGAGEPVSC